jgi:hypothetical protein
MTRYGYSNIASISVKKLHLALLLKYCESSIVISHWTNMFIHTSYLSYITFHVSYNLVVYIYFLYIFLLHYELTP